MWMGKHKLQKSLMKALNNYGKQEEVWKSGFFLENDLERILEHSQLAVERK